MICPVCSCERIGSTGQGVNCVCHSCGSMFPRQQGQSAWVKLVEGLTGRSDALEVGDLVAYQEDPDDRPWWIWDR